MRRLGSVVVGVLIAGGISALAASAAAEAQGRFRIQTLVKTPGLIEGFAQDGDRIVWADWSKSCRRFVQLRDLRTGKTWPLTGRKGPTCGDALDLGGMQHRMALAGRRALWAFVSVSNSAYHFAVYAAAAGDVTERFVGDIHILGGLAREGPFRPVPMAGSGSTLAFADISNAEEQSPTGVYAVDKRTTQMGNSAYTFAVGASNSRIALGRQIPAGCVCNRSPTWSPDGNHIAFTSGVNGGADLSGGHLLREVYLVDASDGPARKLELGSTGFTELAWSRTGSLVLERDYQLYIVPKLGARPRLVARGRSASWSPDGREIAYTGYYRGGEHLFILPTTGGKPKRIAPGAYAQWSPGGESLLARLSDGVYIVPLDGSAARRIAGDGIYTYSSAPDGSQIAYIDQDGIYVVRPDGSGRRRISEAESAFEWSPDSRWIATTKDGDLVIVAADGSGERRLAAKGYDPSWSPDGSTIAYISFEQGSERELAVIRPDGSGKRTLTSTSAAPARSLVELRRPSGRVTASIPMSGAVGAIAMDGQLLALVVHAGKGRLLEVRRVDGRVLRRVKIPSSENPYDYVGLAGRWAAFYARGAIRLFDWRSGRMRMLERVRYPVGMSVEGRRLAWADPSEKGSRIRAVVLPR